MEQLNFINCPWSATAVVWISQGISHWAPQVGYAMADEVGKTANHLPVWGNDKTMNLNTMILTNIQGSAYFKVTLYKLKTYHQVIDEIYFNVAHLEPWERGSRKVGKQPIEINCDVF